MTYTLIVKNPCVDATIVTLAAPVSGLEDYDYILDSGDEVFTAHSPFTINGLPASVPTLCGEIEYEAIFESA